MTTTLAPGFPGALNREKSESITWRSGAEVRGGVPQDAPPRTASDSSSAETGCLTTDNRGRDEIVMQRLGLARKVDERKPDSRPDRHDIERRHGRDGLP